MCVSVPVCESVCVCVHVCVCACMCLCQRGSSGIIQSMFDSHRTPEMATRMKHKAMHTLYIRTHTHVYTSTHTLHKQHTRAHRVLDTVCTHTRLTRGKTNKQNGTVGQSHTEIVQIDAICYNNGCKQLTLPL